MAKHRQNKATKKHVKQRPRKVKYTAAGARFSFVPGTLRGRVQTGISSWHRAPHLLCVKRACLSFCRRGLVVLLTTTDHT